MRHRGALLAALIVIAVVVQPSGVAQDQWKIEATPDVTSYRGGVELKAVGPETRGTNLTWTIRANDKVLLTAMGNPTTFTAPHSGVFNVTLHVQENEAVLPPLSKDVEVHVRLLANTSATNREGTVQLTITPTARFGGTEPTEFLARIIACEGTCPAPGKPAVVVEVRDTGWKADVADKTPIVKTLMLPPGDDHQVYVFQLLGGKRFSLQGGDNAAPVHLNEAEAAKGGIPVSILLIGGAGVLVVALLLVILARLFANRSSKHPGGGRARPAWGRPSVAATEDGPPSAPPMAPHPADLSLRPPVMRPTAEIVAPVTRPRAAHMTTVRLQVVGQTSRQPQPGIPVAISTPHGKVGTAVTDAEGFVAVQVHEGAPVEFSTALPAAVGYRNDAKRFPTGVTSRQVVLEIGYQREATASELRSIEGSLAQVEGVLAGIQPVQPAIAASLRSAFNVGVVVDRISLWGIRAPGGPTGVPQVIDALAKAIAGAASRLAEVFGQKAVLNLLGRMDLRDAHNLDTEPLGVKALVEWLDPAGSVRRMDALKESLREVDQSIEVVSRMTDPRLLSSLFILSKTLSESALESRDPATRAAAGVVAERLLESTHRLLRSAAVRDALARLGTL